jgi:hypothetical protein
MSYDSGSHEPLVDYTHSTFPVQKDERETARAFDACIFFLKMGAANRTLMGAYRAKMGKPDAVHLSSQWREWFRTFEWEKRAEAYDKWIIRSTTEVIVQIRNESIEDVRQYFNEMNLLIIRDVIIDRSLVELLEAATNEQIGLKNSGKQVSTREIRDLAEARRAIISGRKEAHAIALDLLGYSSLPVDTEAEVVLDAD